MCINVKALSEVQKITPNTDSNDLTPAVHGNVVFPFQSLIKIDDFFIEPDMTKRYSIHSAVKNYNKTHNVNIKVSTKKVAGGLLIRRIK